MLDKNKIVKVRNRDNGTVTYRKYGEENSTTVSKEEFLDMITKQVSEYK